MNARILRKWSIHTKNLMSCSVCSLVVVVLLLLLLLVTCAPTLVLATTTTTPTTATTMNSYSPHLLDASLVVNPMQQHYMPKNVIVVVGGGGGDGDGKGLPAKRTTRQRTPATSASATATNTATSLSSQPISTAPAPAAAAATALTTSTSLTNRRRTHRQLSPRVEVADDSESFPGFYTKHGINTDDIRPTPPALEEPWPAWPLRQRRLPRQQFHSVGANSGEGDVVGPQWLLPTNVDNNKDNILRRRLAWPSRLISSSSSHPSSSTYPSMLASFNDQEDDIEEVIAEEEEEEEEQNYDDDTLATDSGDTSLDVAAGLLAQQQDGHKDKGYVSKPPSTPMGVRNIDRTLTPEDSGAQHQFPVQLYQRRRLVEERRPHVAPLQQHDSLPYSAALSSTLTSPPPYASVRELLHMPTPATITQKKRKTLTTTLYSYNNNNYNNNNNNHHHHPVNIRNLGGSGVGGGKNIIFSTTDNKSVPAGIAPEGGQGDGERAVVLGKDNVFDISNILNVNKIKSSAATTPIRFVIESYEVAAKEKRTPTPAVAPATSVIPTSPHLRQLRSRQLQQQQAARSRRDSLRTGYAKRYQGEIMPAPTTSLHQQNFRRSSSFQQQQLQQQQPQHHPHNNNHHNLRQQRNRKHGRRYCSARDPAQLAFEAPTVFEGKIVSMTPDRRSNFSATVEVREVFKQQIGYRLQKYLRLQFAYRNSSGECDIYREQLRPRGLVKGDTIEPGRIYLLFVQQIDIGNFTILGQPIRKTKRVVEAVRNAVSENYAQLASIRSISASNRTVENGQELRIVCKVTGRPPPKVTWFKDHRSINRNRKLYQFTHFKKRSELIIRSFNTSDAGRYECRAKNKVNRNIERRAIVIKAYPVQRFDPNPRGAGNNCPDDASEFCFNGGTCKFFSEISSYSCICPEGFIGERCDRKEVNNPSTYSNEQECGDKKYFGSYYC